jgi:plastocyanin
LPNDDPATWTGSKGETLALILVDFTISDESDEEPPQTDLPYSADVSIPAGSSTTDCMDTNQCYIPADVAIASGGEVVWSNDDNASHTVTSGHPTDGSDGNFDSGLFLPGQTFVHIFDQEGEYPYFCLVHPWMTGTVFVGQSIPNPTPTPTQPPQNLPSEATVLMAKGTASNTNCGDQCYMPNIVSVSAGGTVTWNNVDSAAHTATATDGSFDTSLVNAGASASHTFRNVGTYPYMCILHPWMKGTVIVGQGTPNPTPTPDIELFVDVDKPEYDLGELATLIIHISDVSSPQTVALTVTDPFGTIVVSRTLTTDSEGDASADFKIAESFKTGTYRIDATSLIDGWTYLDDSEFEVISQFNQIQIISAQGTDQQGNPMEFSRGSMGFVKVQVNAQKPIATLITVNVFDSDLTPLGVGSLKTTLNTGQSELILSFMIPEDAVVGTADIYVNALSDWVSAGGIPQTGEFAGQVRIN